MKRILAKLLCALLGALVASVSQAQSPPPYPRTGYTFPSTPGYSDDQINKALDVLQSNGISYIHGDVWWFLVEPQQNQFDWSAYDNFFGKLNSRGMKIYLTLGSGVDGDVNNMPSFLFPHAWQYDLGVNGASRGAGNSLTWDPRSNTIHFNYQNDYLWLGWTPATGRRFNIQPGAATRYKIRMKPISGDKRIWLGYNVWARSTNAWVASFDNSFEGKLDGTDNQCQPDGTDWYKCVFRGKAPDPAQPNPGQKACSFSDCYLSFKIGTAGATFESDFDLNAFVFELPDSNLRVGGADLPIADATKIRMIYQPCWQDAGPYPEDWGIGYLATFSDQISKRGEEENFFRKSIHHFEHSDYADAIVAYSPNNEPFVGPDTFVDYSEANRQSLYGLAQGKVWHDRQFE